MSSYFKLRHSRSMNTLSNIGEGARIQSVFLRERQKYFVASALARAIRTWHGTWTSAQVLCAPMSRAFFASLSARLERRLHWRPQWGCYPRKILGPKNIRGASSGILTPLDLGTIGRPFLARKSLPSVFGDDINR